MAGEFGKFIAEKRLEKDVKLKPIAERLGVSVTYLSDIIKGRRNPPDKDGLEIFAAEATVTPPFGESPEVSSPRCELNE